MQDEKCLKGVHKMNGMGDRGFSFVAIISYGACSFFTGIFLHRPCHTINFAMVLTKGRE